MLEFGAASLETCGCNPAVLDLDLGVILAGCARACEWQISPRNKTLLYRNNAAVIGSYFMPKSGSVIGLRAREKR